MHVQVLLTQRLDLTVRALLTPETLWPEEAQGAGLQHVVLSWPTARPLLDAAFAVRPLPHAVYVRSPQRRPRMSPTRMHLPRQSRRTAAPTTCRASHVSSRVTPLRL